MGQEEKERIIGSDIGSENGEGGVEVGEGDADVGESGIDVGEGDANAGEGDAGSSGDDNCHSEGTRQEEKHIHSIDPMDITIENFHITINPDADRVDVFDLLEKLYQLRHDESLTREEKIAKAQQIINAI